MGYTHDKGVLKERITKDLQQHLTPHRFTHVLGVAKAARILAERYGADVDKAELAGLLHDAAKQKPLEEMQNLARKAFGDTLDPVIMATGSLLHGYAAVTVAKETYGIDDEDILAALAHHTTGAVHMGILEKLSLSLIILRTIVTLMASKTYGALQQII